jgi:hypothetical protein
LEHFPFPDQEFSDFTATEPQTRFSASFYLIILVADGKLRPGHVHIALIDQEKVITAENWPGV